LAVSAVEKIQAKAMFSMWSMWLKNKRPPRLTKTLKGHSDSEFALRPFAKP